MATRKKKKNPLEQKIDALTTIVEKGFSAVAGDIAVGGGSKGVGVQGVDGLLPYPPLLDAP